LAAVPTPFSTGRGGSCHCARREAGSPWRV
jgi:hypothetical protein